MDILWTPDSGVTWSLLAEKDWDQIKSENLDLQLIQEEKGTFRPYGTYSYLPVLRVVHVKLQCKAGKGKNSKLHVIKGQKEFLLGKCDGEELGIISVVHDGKPEERKEKEGRIRINKERRREKERDRVRKVTTIKNLKAMQIGHSVSGGQTTKPWSWN